MKKELPLKRYWTGYREEFIEVLYPFLERLEEDFRTTSIYICSCEPINYRDKCYLKINYRAVFGQEAQNYLLLKKKRLRKFTSRENDIIETPMLEIDLEKWYKRIPFESRFTPFQFQ